jgi:hypothetical protein
MLRSRTSRALLIALTGVVLLTALPSQADAQHRRRVRASVVFFGGFGFPHPLLYDGWYDYRYAYQWRRPYPPYGYPYGRLEYPSSVRLAISPRHAEVFVDGYLAGVVDDFDGIFQRLRVSPGAHELVVYLDGYRTIRLSRYFNAGSDLAIRETMERLAPGETSEPPPAPGPPPAAPERARPQRPTVPEPRQVEPESARFGTLSLRVQPADAEILVDGERWSTPAGEERVAIRLPEGRHRIEIRKDGFATYTEDVLVRPDRTLTLNVSLVRKQNQALWH